MFAGDITAERGGEKRRKKTRGHGLSFSTLPFAWPGPVIAIPSPNPPTFCTRCVGWVGESTEKTN